MKENILLGKCVLKLCQTDAVSSSTKHLDIQFQPVKIHIARLCFGEQMTNDVIEIITV
jgi:hypothetical protein